jgi:hypothetical protein
VIGLSIFLCIPNSVRMLYNTLLPSTDHQLIPARNATLEAMHGSSTGSNVRYYPA